MLKIEIKRELLEAFKTVDFFSQEERNWKISVLIV